MKNAAVPASAGVLAHGGFFHETWIKYFQTLAKNAQSASDVDAAITAALTGVSQYAAATSGLTLGASFADVPGATVTLPQAGTYLITACFDFAGSGAGDAGQQALGQLVAGSVAQDGQAAYAPLVIAGAGVTGSPLACRATVFQQWLYAAVANDVAQLQAMKVAGSGFSICNPTFTTITAVLA